MLACSSRTAVLDGLMPGTYHGYMSAIAEWAWCAGFFDGEGCISHKRKGNLWRLVVQQNVRAPLDSLQRTLGGTVYGPYTRQRSRNGVGEWSNPYWVWRLSKQKEVLEALDLLEPYLQVKGGQARQAVEAIRERLGITG